MGSWQSTWDNGWLFISNPDLVERLRAGVPFAESDKATWCGAEEHGYTDHPTMDGKQLHATE